MKQITLLIFLLFVTLGSVAQDLRITEIMYNPSNSDSAWEWVEVYNAGTELVDLSGYVIDDNTGADYSEANIQSGSIISGQSAILFNASALSETDFLNVWGSVNLIAVTRWSSLNNGGDTIGIWSSFEDYSGDSSSQANVIEQVVYAADGEIWPEDDGSASIYLTNLDLDNNLGTSWLLSEVGAVTPFFTGYVSTIFGDFDGEDVGSPGLASSTDTEKPIITCPEDMTMVSDFDNCGASFLTILPTATDNVSTQFEFQGIRSDGLELTNSYPIGETTVTWTAIDEAGNISESCNQKIVIFDDVKPTIDCPESVEASSLDGNPVLVEIDLATASNACEGEITLGWSRSDENELQDPFPVGTTTITWTATDASENVAECTQTVTISFDGSMESEISVFSVSDELDTIIDNDNKTVVVNVPFGTNVAEIIPIIEVSEGASVFPESGVAQDFSNPVEYTVKAENGSEQIWLVTVIVEDDIVNPIIECPADIVVQNDEGECGAVVEFDIPFTDLDENTILEVSKESGSIFSVGTTEVMAIVTDSSGNSSSCNFDITVEDNIDPILICKDATVQLDAGGNVNILITDVFDTLSDNCAIDSLTASQLSFSEADLGENEVTVTAVDVNGNETSCIALVSVLSFEELDLAVNSFTLVNADTNEDLFLLTEGMNININDLPTLNLDVRANTSENAESVQMSLSGSQSAARTENISPYALFGDTPSGNYNGNDFIEGTYTLTATPYSLDNLDGDQGETLSLNFEIFNEPTIVVTDFMLVNADTNEDLFPLEEGMQIDVNTLPTLHLDIRANTDDAVESVQMQLEGKLEIIRVENVTPYALYGDSPAGIYNGNEFAEGDYKVSATPYALDGLAGEMGSTLSINFELVDLTPTLAVTGFTLVNADTNEDILEISDGMQIAIGSLPTLNLDIRANTTDDIKSVRLTLAGTQTANRTENVSPYAMFGDLPAGDYNGNDFAAGNYSITAVGYSEGKLKGEMGEALTIQFELQDTLLTGKKANPMSIYPNPAISEAIIQFKTPKNLMVIYLYDLLGREVGVFEGNKVANGDTYILDVDPIPAGTYFINSFDENGNSYQKQIVIKN